VRQHGADLGIAWDGDFDRCFFFDEQGEFIEGYYVVGLLAEAFLKRYGPARIVHDPSRADIYPGDILVAANTDPGWTPILSLAGGLVVEEGGLLNHCSIVARELRIPAVVGVRNATRRIPEGARIVIDGGQGLVRIEDDHQEGPQA